MEPSKDKLAKINDDRNKVVRGINFGAGACITFPNSSNTLLIRHSSEFLTFKYEHEE